MITNLDDLFGLFGKLFRVWYHRSTSY